MSRFMNQEAQKDSDQSSTIFETETLLDISVKSIATALSTYQKEGQYNKFRKDVDHFRYLLLDSDASDQLPLPQLLQNEVKKEFNILELNAMFISFFEHNFGYSLNGELYCTRCYGYGTEERYILLAMLFNMPGLGVQIQELVRAKPDIRQIKLDIADLLYFFAQDFKYELESLSNEQIVTFASNIIPALSPHTDKIFDYLSSLLSEAIDDLNNCKTWQHINKAVLHVFMSRTALDMVIRMFDSYDLMFKQLEIGHKVPKIQDLDYKDLCYQCRQHISKFQPKYVAAIKNMRKKLKDNHIINEHIKEYLGHLCQTA